jgi:hypothetical protein
MKIFKTTLIALLLIVASVNLQAQSKGFKPTATQTTALKKQADDMAALMMQRNYKQMAYYTYPQIVKAMGGPDKMAEKVSQMMDEMQSRGMAFKSTTIDNIGDIVKSGTHLYSVIQQILQISNNGSIITGSSYLLAISSDNGKRWYFVDTAPFKHQNIKHLFPDYPPELVIPESHMGGM